MPPLEAWTSHPASFINGGPMVWVCAGMGVLIYLIGVYKVMTGWVLDESTNPRGYRAPWVPPQLYTYWRLYPLWALVLVSPAILWPLIAVYFLLEQICRATVWLLRCCGVIQCLGSCCRWQEREMELPTVELGKIAGNPSTASPTEQPPDPMVGTAVPFEASHGTRPQIHRARTEPARRPTQKHVCPTVVIQFPSAPRRTADGGRSDRTMTGGRVVVRQVGRSTLSRPDDEPAIVRVQNLPRGTRYS